jgi:hypothetical protein
MTLHLGLRRSNLRRTVIVQDVGKRQTRRGVTVPQATLEARRSIVGSSIVAVTSSGAISSLACRPSVLLWRLPCLGSTS